MNNLVLGLFILSIIGSIGVYSIYLIHMFQLNSYKPRVHFNWLRINIGQIIKRTIPIILELILIILFKNIGLILSTVINIGYIYFNRPKKAKLPLAYTHRIKRLILTLGILLIPAVVCTMIYKNELLGIALIFSIFFILTPLIILFANALNRPLEKTIGNWYIKDGMKILQSVKGLTVIGITGSYGKTSVKFYLSKLLSADFNVLHTPESYNTPMGVTITIREQLRSYHEIFICEMGAKQERDIKEICDIVNPDHGIITSIGPQHLESFKSIDNIIKTKFELGDNLKEKGMLFLNYDNEYIRSKKDYENIVSYGIDKEFNPEYLAYNINTSSGGSTFMMDANGETYTFTTKLIGKHNVENIAGAIAIAHKMGVSMEKLIRQVRLIEGVEHRLQLIKRKDLTIIDDCYNSNPMGAKVAIETLNEFEGVKILLTPGMIELGDKQYEYNKEFGVQAAAVCDYVVLVGKTQTKPIYDGLIHSGFNKDNVYVVSGLQEGLRAVDGINTYGEEKIVLMENDLPDNY